MVNQERLTKTFTDLVKIYAPSKGEREVADELKKRLKQLGASKVVEDNEGAVNGGNAGNIIAIFNENMPGLPSIALTAHMDCVENCKDIEPILENGIFTSKGNTILGGDDKAGVAAILEALALMKENYLPHGKITVIFTVQEESGLDGSKNIEEKYIQGIDFGYVLDADGKAGTFYTEGPGHYNIIATYKGKAAHAGIEPEKGINAIQMAAKGIANCPTGRIDEETTCNIGLIEGGMATNIVPETCTVKVEARSRNEEKLEKIVNEIKSALSNVEGEVEIQCEKSYDSFNISEDSAALRLAKDACKAGGFEMELKKTGGGSDANWFGTKGFPAVLMGVGMKDFHTNKENLALQDLTEATELVYRIIEVQPHFNNH